MKKNIMISLSVIFTLMILLFPVEETKAYEFSYNDINFDSNIILEKMKTKYSNVDFDNNYNIHIAYVNGSNIYFFTTKLTGFHSVYDLNYNRITDTSINIVENDSYLYEIPSNRQISYNSTAYYYRYNINDGSETIATATNKGAGTFLYASTYSEDLYGSMENYLDSTILYSNVNISYYPYTSYLYYRKYDTEFFNKTYSSAEYSKIEILWDDFTLNSLGVNWNVLLRVGSVVAENQSGFAFSSPYFEFNYNVVTIDEFGMISTSTKTYKDIVYVSDISDYVYEYDMSKQLVPSEPKNNDKLYSSVKLVIPFDSEVVQSIKVVLDSNLDYEVTEYTNEEFSYNLTSLDLTNKKGAMLVTKDINNTFSSNFKVDGYFYLEFRDSISHSDFEIDKIYTYGFCDELLKENKDYNCSLSNKFSHIFGANNPYKVLYFRNLNNSSDTSSIVYYDSTKFDVYIVENDTSNIIIKDPVSGEDIYFDIDIYEQNVQAEVDVEYLLSLINSFLDENANASDFVKEVLLMFFTKMPAEIYQAFITVLFVIFIGAIIIIVGWK